MILQEKEKIIKSLFEFFDKNENAEVKIVFDDEIIEKAVLDTMYENDDENDEYNIIVMKNISNNSLFEISYHHVPLKVYLGEQIIFSRG